jgi:hypothetical protein
MMAFWVGEQCKEKLNHEEKEGNPVNSVSDV